MEKYLLAPLGLAAGILINLAVHLAFGNDVRKILDSIPLLLVIVLLFTAFEMPLIYKKGIARARIGYLILVALTIAAVGAAPGMIGEQTEAWAVVVTPGILWGIVAVSAWLFLVSMGISMSIYEKKEL